VQAEGRKTKQQLCCVAAEALASWRVQMREETTITTINLCEKKKKQLCKQQVVEKGTRINMYGVQQSTCARQPCKKAAENSHNQNSNGTSRRGKSINLFSPDIWRIVPVENCSFKLRFTQLVPCLGGLSLINNWN